jgi:hypothetical protein
MSWCEAKEYYLVIFDLDVLIPSVWLQICGEWHTCEYYQAKQIRILSWIIGHCLHCPGEHADNYNISTIFLFIFCAWFYFLCDKVLEGLVYLHEQGVIHRNVKGHKYINYERASLLHLMFISTCFFLCFDHWIWWQEMGEGQHVEAFSQAAQRLHPCPSEAWWGDRQPHPHQQGTILADLNCIFLGGISLCCMFMYVSLHLLNNSGRKGKSKPKDEASAGSCAGLQQGNRKALIVDIHSFIGHL